jgi:hypothetical protein
MGEVLALLDDFTIGYNNRPVEQDPGMLKVQQ